jgi:hypothetical protein
MQSDGDGAAEFTTRLPARALPSLAADSASPKETGSFGEFFCSYRYDERNQVFGTRDVFFIVGIKFTGVNLGSNHGRDHSASRLLRSLSNELLSSVEK